MARINKTRYALLGMLSLANGSGYDIKKRMENSTNHFWSEGDGAIYPILNQLLDEGMVTFKVENADTGKPKKTYTITDDGLTELQDWLMMSPEYNSGRDELLLKIFFGNNVDKEVIKAHIENYRLRIQANIDQYLNIETKFKEEKIDSKNIFQYLTLKAGIIYSQAGLTWCDEVLKELDNVL